MPDQVYELPAPSATPLIVNTDDWLKALRAVSQHQETLSREAILECQRTFGHRRCCSICGDTTEHLSVCNQTENPIAALLCDTCVLIQLEHFHTPFYQMRDLNQYEDDVLRMTNEARK